jgi:NTP pyrophosphatase (non-canonical NTP hydrolase)
LKHTFLNETILLLSVIFIFLTIVFPIIYDEIRELTKVDNNNKTLTNLQQEVDKYINSFKEGYFPPMELLARLTEELGELSREVQHVYGVKKKKSNEAVRSLEEETGDLFFVLVCFANSQGISLEKALSTVIDKYKIRDADRWTKKEETK